MPTPCQAMCPVQKVIRTHCFGGLGGESHIGLATERLRRRPEKNVAGSMNILNHPWFLLLSQHTKPNPLAKPKFFLSTSITIQSDSFSYLLQQLFPDPTLSCPTYNSRLCTRSPASNMVALESFYVFKQPQSYFKCKLNGVIYLLKRTQWIPITLTAKSRVSTTPPSSLASPPSPTYLSRGISYPTSLAHSSPVALTLSPSKHRKLLLSLGTTWIPQSQNSASVGSLLLPIFFTPLSMILFPLLLNSLL